jgi:dihydropteroate synthase
VTDVPNVPDVPDVPALNVVVRPLVMGILNVTPDSFSDGGLFADPAAAITHGRQMFADGADIVDVGGESTRPGATPVGTEAELSRVLDVVEALSEWGTVSIDTRSESVARSAVNAGASIINDVSASLEQVAAELGVGWVAMHMSGDPATMQVAPVYDDVVGEVLEYLVGRAEAAVAQGVDRERLWIDPGIGFGKTSAHNLAIIGALDEFVLSGWRVAVGASRKSFIGAITGASVPHDRLEGSLAVAMWAMRCGVGLVRVHDVHDTVAAREILVAEIEEAA